MSLVLRIGKLEELFGSSSVPTQEEYLDASERCHNRSILKVVATIHQAGIEVPKHCATWVAELHAWTDEDSEAQGKLDQEVVKLFQEAQESTSASQESAERCYSQLDRMAMSMMDQWSRGELVALEGASLAAVYVSALLLAKGVANESCSKDQEAGVSNGSASG